MAVVLCVTPRSAVTPCLLAELCPTLQDSSRMEIPRACSPADTVSTWRDVVLDQMCYPESPKGDCDNLCSCNSARVSPC